MIDAYAGRLPDPVLNFGGRPMNAFSLALTATCFTFLCTAAGAAFVFVVGHSRKKTVVQVSLGFAAGIMLAASVFGLLIPSIDGARAAGGGLVPPAGGFVLGVLLLMLMNRLVPHLHTDADEPEGVRSGLGRQSLLFLAITIHNVPEGMALGVLAAAAGTVLDCSYSDAYGYCVTLEHENGVRTMYAHLSAFYAEPGDTVAQGQIIAAVGATGWTTGPHLHLSVFVDDESVDPLEALASAPE